jgi:23S rRNA G2445 N2-methylase RlmL
MSQSPTKQKEDAADRKTQRSIRQKVVGRAQTAIIIAPPGFLEITKEEITSLLTTLQTPIKEKMELVESQGRLLLDNVSFANITEIALRAKTISDIRLRLFKRRVSNLKTAAEGVQSVDYSLFLKKGQRVRLRASCERSLINNEKEVEKLLARLLEERGFPCESGAAPGGDDTSTTVTLHAVLEHNVFSIELGLAGAPLYHRGYRAATATLAPLREDLAAAACLQAKLFQQQHGLSDPDFLFVPYAGSGTLGFEGLLAFTGLTPSLFRPSYALEHLLCHSAPTFSWIKKQLLVAARESHVEERRCVFVEKHPGQERELAANINRFIQLLQLAGAGEAPILESVLADLFSINLDAILKNARRHIFVPLNPPYGLRLESSKNIEALYRSTGRLLALLAAGGMSRGIAVSGFILCPSEQSWEQFSRAIPSFRRKTTHFTQGGRDIRLCHFCSPQPLVPYVPPPT